MNENENRLEEIKTLLRYAVSKSPGFAAIALWCPLALTENHYVAATNGRTIRIGAHFFNYSEIERAAILVHEILHIALRHIPRAKKKNLEMRLWNLCTDAVINEAISQIAWLQLPDDAVRLHALLEWRELQMTPAHLWTSEKLYDYLKDRTERVEQLLSKFFSDLELFDDGSPREPLEDNIWKERLMRAQAGDRPGGLIRGIAHEFPDDTLPWENILRRQMTEPLLPRSKTNWSRPHRRTLAGATAHFEPSTRPPAGVGLAGVVVDTSGSIDDFLLGRFAREIQGIQQRTGCAIYLISADAAVQTEQLIKNDGVSFLRKLKSGKIEFKGGGGTDFFPALQRMKEKKVKVVVYLTDLMGNFGDERKYPYKLIWASTTKNERAPFGTTIYLE